MAAGKLVDAQGNPVELGAEIGKGGEGAVYDIRGRADNVAKLYSITPDRAKAEKIAAMVPLANERLLKLAAWPTATLHTKSGAFAGFTMPKAAGHRPVFQLYGPKLRLQQFPRADWRFLIHAAANTARAFSVIHAAGHVIGDVNHGNLLVGQDATVCLIDTDSFQVSANGHRWLCEVGVGTHQPPEMQNTISYKNVVRTPNHDNFGLAVIIFQLLCMARHPFSGRYVGTGEPPAIEPAIEHFRYAYSRDQSRTQMLPAPGSLSMDALPVPMRDAFEQSFGPDALRGNRPTPNQWVALLQELSGNLHQCKDHSGHHYLAGLTRCPWCEIEGQSGTVLFPVTFIAGAPTGDTIVVLWQQVTALAEPGPMPPLPTPAAKQATASAAALDTRRRRRQRQALAVLAFAAGAAMIASLAPLPQRALLLVLLGGICGSVLFWRGGKATRAFRATLRSVEQDWKALKAEWAAKAPGPPFARVRQTLETQKRDYDDLPNQRARRLQKLWEDRRQSQMAEHLDRCQIALARIPNIGRAKVATLQSYGIDTAADIDAAKIIRIPGFGPATVKRLTDWRHAQEGQFRFDSARGPAQATVNAVENDIMTRRRKLEQDITAGLAQLTAIVRNTSLQQRALEGKAAELAPRLAQALADAKATGIRP